MQTVIIGLGAIGRMIVDRLAGEKSPVRLQGVLVRPARAAEAREELASDIAVFTSAEDVIEAKPDMVVECAGQAALKQYGETLLGAGLDLMVVATGALAKSDYRAKLMAAAEKGGARLHVPAGATAGLDGLGALRAGGLAKVTYTSTKPSHAWKGTPAEQNLDLDSLREKTVIFEGRAEAAALDYPQNANLAATIAMAGAGFDNNFVRLVADPDAIINCGRIEADGEFGHMTMEMRGHPMASNPKTSAVTALSLIYALNKETSRFVI
ncbi:MAG: aspartate dehydrogenase [Pseudomonadota bacterium]|nr:aspartate dehydrogenase [Pseudomonadota bacterium]